MQKHIRSDEEGSLLMEILVAFALVSVTMIVLVSAFLNFQKGYRMVLVQKEVTDAVAYAFQDMTREARVSNTYASLGSGTTLGMTHIEGLNAQAALPVVYTVSGGQITRRIGVAPAPALPLTPPSVRVTNFTVEAITEASAPNRVVVMVVAEPTDTGTGVSPVYMQTSFTERY